MAIDEISNALGKYEVRLDNIDKAHIIILSKLDNISDKLTLINGDVKKAHTRIDILDDDVITKKAALKIVLSLGLLGGASGMGFSKAISVLFGIQ